MALQFNVQILWDGGSTFNPIINPSFETDLADWSSIGTWATNTRVSTFQHFGDYSNKLINSSGSVADRYAVFTATETTSTISIWVYREAGSATLQLLLQENFGGFSLIAATTAATTTGKWIRLTASGATTPASDYRLRVSSATGNTFYMDGAQVDEGSTATPYYDGDVGDETTYMMHGRCERGRRSLLNVGANGFTPQGVGELTLTMKNHDGRYDPLNSSSPLYGAVEPGKQVRVTVTEGGTIYNVFRGHISNIQPMRDGGGANTKRVKITVKDGWQWLRDRKITYAPQVDSATGDNIDALLTAAEYPFASDVDTGVDVVPYWWAGNRSAQDEIQSLVDSEFGLVWIDGNGTLTFRARPYQWGIASTATWTGANITDIDFAQPWDVMRNVIQVKAYPTDIIFEQTVWTNSKAFKIRDAQEITLHAEYSYEGNPTSAKDIEVSLNAFANRNGTGDNLSLQVTTLVDEEGEGASVTLQNVTAPGRTAYITFLSLVGTVINRTDAVVVESDTSGGNTRRTFLLDVPWQQDVEKAQLYAEYLALLLDEPRAAPTIRTNTHKAGLAKQMADLNTVHTLNLASEGINRPYRRCGVVHEWDAHNQNLIQSEIYFETADTTTYWTLGTSEFDGETILSF